MKRTAVVPVFVVLMAIASFSYGADDSGIVAAITERDKLSEEAASRGDYRTAIAEISKAIALFEKEYG
ncbi:MAG TPA: hypothetical protein PKK43_04860, partial [Spirochaetota bacterium]|nr:hypothetical protein [Spirochaetota bacterium]